MKKSAALGNGLTQYPVLSLLSSSLQPAIIKLLISSTPLRSLRVSVSTMMVEVAILAGTAAVAAALSGKQPTLDQLVHSSSLTSQGHLLSILKPFSIARKLLLFTTGFLPFLGGPFQHPMVRFLPSLMRWLSPIEFLAPIDTALDWVSPAFGPPRPLSPNHGFTSFNQLCLMFALLTPIVAFMIGMVFGRCQAYLDASRIAASDHSRVWRERVDDRRGVRLITDQRVWRNGDFDSSFAEAERMALPMEGRSSNTGRFGSRS